MRRERERETQKKKRIRTNEYSDRRGCFKKIVLLHRVVRNIDMMHLLSSFFFALGGKYLKTVLALHFVSFYEGVLDVEVCECVCVFEPPPVCST